MESLTRENFWNNIAEKYPDAMENFSEFLQVYKLSINWDSLFGDGLDFYQLPYEMQTGIIDKFIVMLGASGNKIEAYNLTISQGVVSITDYFCKLQFDACIKRKTYPHGSKRCGRLGCISVATNEVLIGLRDKATVPYSFTKPVAILCNEHSMPDWDEVVTPDLWEHILSDFRRQGLPQPKRGYCRLEIRTIKSGLTIIK